MAGHRWVYAWGTVGLVALAGCAVTTPADLEDQGYQALNGQQVEVLHGQPVEMEWRRRDGLTGTTQFEPDGSATVFTAGQTFDGQWRVANGELCTTYADIQGGETQCYQVFGKEGEPYKFFLDGEHVLTATYP